MATITAIRPSQRDPDRATVHVDGRVAATLSLRSIGELGLSVGGPCDDALREQLQRTAAIDKAVRQSLNRLGRRAMSRGRLDRKLRELGYDEPTRTAALERLTAADLLDDRAYAESLVRELRRRRPAGPNLLRQKLYEHLLPREVIEAVLSGQADAAADAEAATALAQQRAAQLRHVEPVARRRRIYGLLARRGFDPETIRDAMRALDRPDDRGGAR